MKVGVVVAVSAALPQAKVEAIMGGAVTLAHFGKSDFIRTALVPGTELGTWARGSSSDGRACIIYTCPADCETLHTQEPPKP